MQKTERNIGIDILRNLAMFGVVVLHCIGHGSYLDSSNQGIMLLYIICYCAVDVFVCITGYVYVNKKIKIARLAELWVTLVFWSIVLTSIIGVLSGQGITIKSIISSFFPIISGSWWFMSAYMLLLVCVPFLNKLIDNISKREHGLLIVIMIVYACLSLVVPLTKNDVFYLNYGYSPIWFIFLYIIGAYIKKYQPLTKLKALVLYIVFLMFTIIGKEVTENTTILMYEDSMYDELVLSYVSPFVMLQAIGLLAFFSQLCVQSKLVVTIVERISVATLGVYLISDQRQMRELIMSGLVNAEFMPSSFGILFKILICAVIIFVSCILLDMVRYKLFEKIKNVNKL